MMVRPDEMRASRAPNTTPLKHCDRKLAQFIISRITPQNGGGATPQEARSPAARQIRSASGVFAEVAPEGIRLLHQRRAGHDFEHLPVVLLILHVLGRL